MASIAKIKNIECLVCGGSTTKHYLGIDACRACSIFYRRAIKRKGKPYICRNGQNQCKIDREDACKACRYAQLRRLLGNEVLSCVEAIEDPSPSTASPMQVPEDPGAPVIPLINVPPLANPPEIERLPILARLRKSYAIMCRLRIMGERSAEMSVEEIITRKIKLNPMNLEFQKRNANIFITALMDFCEEAFSEFPTLENGVKWQIAQKFHEIVAVLENSYRSAQYFGNDTSIPDYGLTQDTHRGVMRQSDQTGISSYTTYVDLRNWSKFYAGAPGRTKDAERMHQTVQKDDAARARKFIMSTPINEMEMVAGFGLELWNTENYSLPEYLHPMFDGYRQALLKEMHVYYTDILLCADYASRLGNLFSLISNLKAPSRHHRENLEILRLLDVFDGSELPYKLHCT